MADDEPTPNGLLIADQELAAAVGRVAMESALQEELLRDVLALLVGDSGWILFEGQSAEWLIQACRISLNEVDHWHSRWKESDHERFNELLRQTDHLRKIRNVVVHGRWEDSPYNDEVVPRPWGAWENSQAYYCLRSRLRRGFETRAFTVPDLTRLAESIYGNSIDLADHVRQMHRAWVGSKYPALPRWRKRTTA
ncbi:hypothetical protein [Micromonospora sp. WMMC250]|uniref:hypothetical protein n=1 Tax=Micromonospora sp. WMMC250 TaxID=3014781 RepID=UPI0022B71230|nr:hypothetical protein [Micromonospora sp. WMMC250]MCZ7377305.1 hypothetical protein [Micromonospora sp. WMMC250]